MDETKSILAGVEYDPSTKLVTKASGIMNIWPIKHNGVKHDGSNEVDEIAIAWESVFIRKIIKENEMKELPSHMKMNALAERR